jgi:heptosyltransferase-2
MKILIVGPAWVGDMVIAHALVRTLLTADPAAEIHVVAPAATASLGRRMPGVAESVTLPVRHGELGLGARRDVGRALRRVRYDRAIVLPNSFKSALVPFFAAIPRRTGWRGEWRYGVLNDIRTLDAPRMPRLVDRFVALGDASVAFSDASDAQALEPRLSADPNRAAALVAELGLKLDWPILALCPGAEYGPAKRWPAAHYAAVAAEHVRRDGAVWLFGAAGDAAVCAAIRASVPPSAQPRVFDLAGRTQLLDAVDLLSLARQVVTNDSGLMHVACALGVPVVAIYGSSSPTFTPPLSPCARVVRDALPCSPCFQRTCPLGHTDCLNRLMPERVVAELLH